MERKTFKFINYALVIGALFVILTHSMPTSFNSAKIYGDSVMNVIYNADHFFVNLYLPIFFFISGLLLKHTRGGVERQPYFSFIGKKAIKLLVPYIVLTVIGFIPKILLKDYVNDDVEFSFLYVVKTIFVPRDNVWGHTWFLPTLFLMFVFSYPLLDAEKRLVGKVTVLLIAVILFILPHRTNILAADDFCCYFIYFVLGIVLSDFILNNSDKIFKWYFGLLAVAVAVVIFLFVPLKYYNYNFKKTMLILALLLIYATFCLTASITKGDKTVGFFEFFDGKTFTIYLLAWLFQAPIEILFNRVIQVPIYVHIIVKYAFGLIFPLIVVWVYKKLKIQNKFLRSIVGL